jgi:hypothetical protein
MATRTEQRAHWTDVIHAHNCQDAVEDVAQAKFIRSPTDPNLDDYILQVNNSLACDRALLETLMWEKQWRWDARRPS